ncbi:tetratricopeptide repeat protein [Roseomonas aerophila]|uniref:Tetratricopeptide repeat protein n=1 Tax=Teichococcus aerophilus TaxID=1224513 RepID=A0ABR7RMF4_9PROT|nr:tetratricopeptide repeat protein [Pseudoroseomonas aerophila]MBC9207737.1 tetratricopeptide repeat protein [Pseudoroseomonas aerophila]
MRQDATISSPLETALRHHRAGDLAAAERLYRAALRQRPRDSATHNLFGLCCYQRHDHAAATAALRRAVALHPAAEYCRNLGMALRAEGKLEEALAAYRRALASEPEAPETHFNTGNLLAQMRRPEEAILAFRAALRLRPTHGGSWHNLGAALIAAGRPGEAVEALRTGLEREPGQPKSLHNLGLALEQLRRWPDAIAAFRAALGLGGFQIESALHLGHCLIRMEDWRGAGEAFSVATGAAADKAEAWLGLGLARQAQGLLEEAHDAFTLAAHLRPDGWEAQYHLARLAGERHHFEEAEAAALRACALAPEEAQALTQLGNLLTATGMPERALDCYERAVAVAPEDEAARIGCARQRLMLGRLGAGWDLTSGRWRPEDQLYDEGLPLWDGQPLPEGRILIWREQGIGDEIMFASLLPELLAAGHRLSLLCDPRLRSVFARAFPTLAFHASGAPLGDLRAQIPMGDLPRLLRRDEAAFAQATQPYLRADAQLRAALRQRYDDGRPLVGLAWRSLNAASATPRSMTLADAMPLLADQRFRFVSLQYGDAAQIAAEAAGLPLLVDPQVDALSSAEDALAQVACMDCVVSIDNSTVHFAGALGVACHVMLPAVAEWRWMVGRADSPWYPSLHLSRQRRGESWREFSARVAPRLQNHAKKLRFGTRSACEK